MIGLLAPDAREIAREAERLHGEIAGEEDLAGDLVVLATPFEAGEAEGELAALRDVEAYVGVVTGRAEVEPPEGFVRREVVAEILVVHSVGARTVLRHGDGRLVEFHAGPVDLGLSRVDDL